MDVTDVDVTGITAVRPGLRERVHGRLSRPVAAPSLRAQLVLLASALLLGGVLSSLLFVGVWRHTAAEGDRARAAQLENGQALQQARARLARSEHALAQAQAALATAQRAQRRLAGELAGLRRADTRAAKALTPRLQALVDDAGALGHETAKLGSALTTLRDYLGNASSTGIDPAFLASQVDYLIGSAATARTRAATLATEAERAQAAATPSAGRR